MRFDTLVQEDVEVSGALWIGSATAVPDFAPTMSTV